MDLIVKVAIKYEQDLPLVRQRAQQIARLAGLSTHDQTRLTVAISEIARNAFQYADGGFVELGILWENGQQLLQATIRDQGPGIPPVETMLDSAGNFKAGHGLVGAQKLVDQFSISTAPGRGTEVRLAVRIPADLPPITPQVVTGWVETMAQEAPRTPLQEIQEQNQKLVQILEKLRENEEALKQQLHEIRRLEKIRDDLTHTMVHDLRNPLSIIYATLGSLLASEATTSKNNDQGEMLEIAVLSTKMMVRLVDNILDVSRLESNQLPLHYAQVSLQEIIDDVIRAQSPLAAFKEIRLKQEVDPALAPLQLDPELINRVFQNLADNALKFTPEGGDICISARLGRRGDQRTRDLVGPFVCVQVSDNGPGIPPDVRDDLFDKFVTRSQNRKGSGLGLTFCKLVVEAHGGEIYVESEPERGTDFILTLPFTPEPDQIQPARLEDKYD